MKIICVFGLILALGRLRFPLSLSLFTGSLFLGLWTGMGPIQWLRTALLSIAQTETLVLCIIVGLIMVLSRMMQGTGHMERLVQSLTRLSRDARTVGSVMSALIGLLPMPGGALFSAPFVETSLSRNGASGEQKTMLNYWFRHIWEFSYPMYPGWILAVALLETETWRFLGLMAPMTLFAVLIGIVFILRPLGNEKGTGKGRVSGQSVKEFLWEGAPLWIVILVILMLAVFTAVLGKLGYHVQILGPLSILPGLAGAALWVGIVNHLGWGQFKEALKDRRLPNLFLLLLAIMLFKGILVESQAVLHVRQELMAYGIPVLIVILIIPFLSGLMTGVAIGFVGTSFPLVVPMIQSDQTMVYLSMAGLAFSFGFMGMMMSPVHLCLLVTKDYFKADLVKIYRSLILPVIATMMAAGIYFSLTRAL